MTPGPSTTAAVSATKCELAGEVLRTSGKLRLQVNGWSMLPSVWPGDTLLVESIPSGRVAEGDIALYFRDRRLFAHRVVSAVPNQEIITRGDAMLRPDPPVSHRELLGRVVALVRDGKVIEPRPSLRVLDRFVAALVRRSTIAARVLVRAHNFCQAFAS